MLNKSLFPLLFLISFLFPHSSYCGEIDRILSMVDYIGGDYSNAVSEGEVVNEFEYDEMLFFSSTIVDLWKKTTEKKEETADFSEKFALLRSMIISKEPVFEVKELADELKRRIISAYDIKPYPSSVPDYENGKAVYATHCSACHGVSGSGDGYLSKDLNPPASDFTDSELNLTLSPFKVYNTVTFGIEGTSMTSFEKSLDKDEKWNVAFYVLSLGYPDGPAEDNFPSSASDMISSEAKRLDNLALLSNEELLATAGGEGVDKASILSYLRTVYLREEIAERTFSTALSHTVSKLEAAIELHEAGRKDEALEEVINGYLEGFQKIEPVLVSKKRSLVYEVEKKMGFFRSWIMSERDSAELRNLKKSIEKDLREAENVLRGGTSLGKYLSFLNSFSIILREALEALLIIAAIITSLIYSGRKNMIKYVHYGWILAIVAGVATWAVAKTAIEISGLRREVVEGVTSLLAAAVLFYVSYWLASKAEVKKWKEYVRSKTQNVGAGRKSAVTLAFVSFLAVYREAFETLLFYQALFYQANSSTPHVIYGLIAGIAAVLAIAFLMYKLTLRIPLKYFFSFASVFLYTLCFILLGKGTLELQEAGIISSTSADFIPYSNVLGIYPTYETAIPQFILLILAAFMLTRRYGTR